ncbi:MAG: dethiobiotin synthase [bacterium]
MARSYFVAGTDTEVGKTLITGLLARFFSEKGETIVTQKWVHSGTTISLDFLPEDLLRHDQLMLREPLIPLLKGCSEVSLRCPYRFALPASAHLAAEAEGAVIDPGHIKQCFRLLEDRYDRVLVEGIGGLLLPYSREATLLEIVKELDLSVILVVANRLGAINHALLTLEVLKTQGVDCVGMIWTCPAEEGDATILADNPKIVSQLTGIQSLCSLGFFSDFDSLYTSFEGRIRGL